MHNILKTSQLAKQVLDLNLILMSTLYSLLSVCLFPSLTSPTQFPISQSSKIWRPSSFILNLSSQVLSLSFNLNLVPMAPNYLLRMSWVFGFFFLYKGLIYQSVHHFILGKP